MGSPIDDPPLIQHHDLVRFLHRRKTMSDHQNGAAGHRLLEAKLNCCFGFGIQSAGGLIQQQQGWISENGSGNRDPLQLTARNIAAAFLQLGGIAVRQGPDEVIGIGQPGGLLNGLIRGRPAESDRLGNTS